MRGENLTVAKRYARALFELAKEKDRVEEIDEQAMELQSGLQRRQVSSVLQHPEIPLKAKREAIKGLVQEEIERPLQELLDLMLERNREEAIESTLDYYDLLTDRYRGVEDVVVTTAIELDEEQKREVLDAVDHFSDYDYRAEFEVDPSILGGVIVQLGRNQLIDGSLRGKMKDMRENLSGPAEAVQ